MKHPLLLVATLIFSLSAFSQQDTISIFFDTDKYEISTEYEKALQTLITNNNSNISINAYTDAPATNKYNQQLSTKRAYKAYYYLLNLGVNIEDIKEVNSYGEKLCGNSVAPNKFIRRADIIYSISTTTNVNIGETVTPEKKLIEQIETTEVGNKLIIKNINFYPGRHFHLPQSEPQMLALLDILKNNPKLRIEIQGHICCQSGGIDGLDQDTHDRQLSVNRAKRIYDYLINNGIDSSRLSYRGFGSSRKIYQFEMNEQERVANRRVEILILEK